MSLIVTVTRIDLDNKELLPKQREYARMAVNHGLILKEHFDNGNSPFHKDLIYSQMFDLDNKKELNIYNKIGDSWVNDATEAHVYLDLGINKDMISTIINLEESGLKIKFKTLNDKKMIQRAVSSLKSTEEAMSFYDLQKHNLVDFNYNINYMSIPKNEIFKEREYLPHNFDNSEFKRIILESPFAGDVENNVLYVKDLIHKLAHEGYAPSASHILYTQCLDDTIEKDRNLGINKGLDYAHNKDSIIGIDRGISGGMKYGIKRAENEGRSYRFETLSDNKETIKEVSKLRDLQDAIEYVDKKTKLNKTMFEQTGYINKTNLTKKIENTEKSNKSKNILKK